MCYLDFDGRFEFLDLENPHIRNFTQNIELTILRAFSQIWAVQKFLQMCSFLM